MSFDRVNFWHWKLASKMYSVLLQVVLSFETTGTGGDVDNDDPGVEVYLSEFGEVSIEYDIEELLAVNGRLKFSLLDNASYIYNRLFSDDAAFSDYTKRMFLLLEYSGVGLPYAGYAFQGGIAAETMEYNERQKLFSAMAIQEHKFNSVALYKDGESLNPLGYAVGASHKLQDVILALLGLVGYFPATEAECDWIWKGTTGGETPTVIDDITFEELYIKTDDLFRNPDSGLTTVGDLLRQLAFELGCYFGVFRTTMHFFRPLAKSNVDKQKAVSNDAVIERKNGFNSPAPYVRVQSMYDYVAASVFEIGDSSYNGSSYAIDRKAILLYTGNETDFQFNLWVLRSGIDYAIIGAKTPITGEEYYQYSEAPARYWYALRNTGNRLKTKEVKLHGFEWEFLDEPLINGVVHRILKMATDYQKNTTSMTLMSIDTVP
jgi:hypothetical protein